MDKEELERFQASRVVFDGGVVEAVDRSGVRTPEFVSIGTEFINCRFESMRIDRAGFGAGMNLSTYRGCSFDRTRIKDVGGGLVRFEGCSFRDVVITGWSLQACDVVDCVFSGTMKSGRGGGSFWGAPQAYLSRQLGKSDNEFRGNDFSGCALVGMDFRNGVDLTLQVLPTGPQYVYVQDGLAAVDRAQPMVEAWSDDRNRAKALGLLEIVRKDLLGRQRQLFLSNASGWLDLLWPQLCNALEGVSE